VIGFVGFLASSVIFLNLSFYGLASEDVETEEWMLWTILVVCLIAGGLVGALLVKARKIGLAILAAWGGVTLGLLLTTTIVIENTYAFYGLIVLCGVVCFYAAFKTERYVIMIATAHIGAYLFVRGISFYAGGFPTEASLHSEIQSGAIDWNSFPKTFYAYLAGIILMSLLGFRYQRIHDKKEEAKKKALEENEQLLNQQDGLTIEERKKLMAQNANNNANNNEVVAANQMA